MEFCQQNYEVRSQILKHNIYLEVEVILVINFQGCSPRDRGLGLESIQDRFLKVLVLVLVLTVKVLVLDLVLILAVLVLVLVSELRSLVSELRS